jgi:hypothetical protein
MNDNLPIDPTVTQIDTPDPAIKAFHDYWTRNREIVAGSRVVRPNAARYLTKPRDMTTEDFRLYANRVPFFPGATRAYEGLMGLINREAPTILCPDGVRDVLETITAQGFTIEDLAEDLHSERLITNYTGLVTDYPVAPKGMSLATAIDQGFRPFIAMYKAESILGIELGVIGNRQRVTRVRLLDDTKTVRELRLIDNVYSIVIHRNDGGTWKEDAPIVPTRGGQTLNEIPFTLDSSSRDFMPVNAPLGGVVDLNIAHYIASANYATEQYFSTCRIIVTGNLENEDAKKLATYPGARWNFEKPDVESKFLAPTDNVLSDLRQTVEDLHAQMITLSSRISEGDTSSNVAAETLRIRDNSSNASLAGIVRRGDRSLNDQLQWVCYWLGIPEDAVTYESNTDFGASPLTAQDVTSRMALWQAGAISLETFLNMMIESGFLPENFDIEADKAISGEEIADRPTTDTTKDIDPEDPEPVA